MNDLFPQKLIGGKFGFPITFARQPQLPQFLSGDSILLFNARSGIKLVIDQLKPPRIWLPSYLCPTIITAVNRNFSEIHFYPVNKTLTLLSEDFLSSLRPGDLFLCIDYFGFSFDNAILAKVKQHGCKILRDCSQALFFDFSLDDLSDFHLFSPRKFLGVPDGGILQMKNRLPYDVRLLRPPDDQVLMLLVQALLQRREFDRFGGTRTWFDLFNEGENKFQPGDQRMSELTEYLLRSAFDYHSIQQQRCENYIYLLSRLGDFALFPYLPTGVVPLGFPVHISSRDKIQKQLFEHSIYPPVHWNISENVPVEFDQSHKLAKEVMTLPCDQRYDRSDMEFIADTFLELVR